MKALLGGTALIALILGLCASLGTRRADAFVILPWPTETSSGHVLGGRALCTASVRSAVQAGQSVSVQFTLRNLSRHSIELPRTVFDTSLVLKAGDGTTYDSEALSQGLPVPPSFGPARKFRAGKTLHLGTEKVPVRWRGPLRVTPECEGQALTTLNVSVTAPWPSPAPSTAVGEVVAAAGHLLDHCLPQTPGIPVDGQIDPPSGSAAPMNAQCSISLSSQGGFLDAQVLVLVPAALSGVQVFQPYELLWPNGSPIPVTLAAAPPYEAIAWEFVVTRDKATPVAASTSTASAATGQSALSFTWNGKGWESQGAESCGGNGFAWGGTGPDLEFISACS